jgi:PPE-repeat protein
MDFATLPPEVNSARMYAGPGSGPMLAAAAAWESLASELYSTASSYQSVVSGLTTGQWLGPSSVSMAAAAASYAGWMSATAAQADQTASQAIAAASAYEAAFAATVPPEEVAANRALLMQLVATNVLGQNTPAIAATETQYGEMWAQDVGAMSGYSGASAAATQMAPFSSPQQNTNPAGQAGQATAVTQAAGTSAGTAQSVVSNAATSPSSVLGSVGSAGAALNGGTALTPLDLLGLGSDFIAFGIDAPISPLGVVSMPIDLIGAETGIHTDDIVSNWQLVGGISPEGPAALVAGPQNVTSTTMLGGLGEAKTVGALSVPPTWAAATPAVRPMALALPATSVAAGEQLLTSGSSSALSEVALASTAARSMTDAFGPRRREPARAGGAEKRVAASAADDAASDAHDAEPQTSPHIAVTGVAAEIRDLGRLRDEGLMTDEEFTHQKRRLLGL